MLLLITVLPLDDEVTIYEVQRLDQLVLARLWIQTMLDNSNALQ